MNLQKMMKQAQEMQSRMTDMQARMEAFEAEGKAGGGVVSVRINGKHDLLSVAIDAGQLTADNKETLEDLIVAAHRNARETIDSTFDAEMKKISSGINLPPGIKLPF